MSIYRSRRKSQRRNRSQLGHLKISINEESSALVVTVFEARGLLRKVNSSLDTYTKLYLLPDPLKQTKEKTKTVRQQKDPVFNEKISFILTEQDSAKRLFISVWSHHSTARNEMIGCMSFLVADLLGPDKGLNGWYQLLDGEKGQSENLQVPTSISKYESTTLSFQRQGQRVFAVTLARSQRGYGFSIHGHNPVYVTLVDEDLPAQEADIQVGDAIIEVEGTDVTRASGELVINIIRKCPDTLHLILQRTAASPFHRSRATISYHGPSSIASLSQSFVSIPAQTKRRPPLHGIQYTSQTQLTRSPDHPANRRLSSPSMTQSPPHMPMGGGNCMMMSQPVDMGMYSPQFLQHEGMFTHEAFFPSYSQWMSNSGRKSTEEQIPEEGGLYEQTTAGDGWSRQESAEGSGSNLHVRRLGTHSQSQKSSDSHEDRHDGHNKFAFSQPREPEHNGYVGAHVHPGGRSRYLPDRFSLIQYGNGMEGDIFARTNSFSPSRNRNSLHGAMGTYQPKALRGTIASNGSIVDSAYASGLSNQSNNQKSPVEGEEVGPSSRFPGAGMGMRLEDRGLVCSPAHQLRPSTSVTSRSSLTGSRDSSHTSRGLTEEEIPVEWESLGVLGQRRQQALNSLVDAEIAFYEELNVGIETYIEPLKTIISDSAHSLIFMNLEELHALSQDLVGQLKSRRVQYSSRNTPTPFYIATVADLYHFMLDQLVGEFEYYLSSCVQARQEIALCFTNQEFTTLVQDSVVGERKPSIYSFVESGKEYLQKMTKYMMGVSYFTPLWHEDHRYFTTIIQGLVGLCPERSLVSKWETDKQTMESLQLCIGFSQGVQRFRVVVPGRLLLHEGEVILIEKRRKKKIWLMLFSDILLLTKRQGKIMTTITAPIPLEQLIVQDINCAVTEFQIATVNGVLNRLMRAHTTQDKNEWMQKMKERATGSLAHRRRPNEKTALRNLPKIDAPKKTCPSSESAPLERAPSDEQDTGESVLSMLTTVANGEVEGERRRMKRQLSQQHEAPQDTVPMERISPKRRSLFNVGAKPDVGKGKDKKRNKKTQQPPSLERVSVEVLSQWESSFDSLLQNPDGMELFEAFLKSEFSEENIQFWKACERYKTVPARAMKKEAEAIFAEFISQCAPKLVNIDHQTTKGITESMKSPDHDTFKKAQHSIYLLMARDSYVRFVKSEQFQVALKR